jgi:SAM-dependent methyltransferase
VPSSRLSVAIRGHLCQDGSISAEAVRREYASVMDRIAADGPQRILDWGCGGGYVSHELVARGFDVESTDYQPEAPGRRASTFFPDVEIDYLADTVELPFPDDSFDAVLSLGVLEHVAHPERSLDELHRVLRPHGKLYVYKLPNRYSWLEWVARRTGLDYHGMRPDDTIYTVRSAVEMVRAHGFSVTGARRANMLPLTMSGALAGRLAGAVWALNRALARVPVLNLLATNVELIATREP